MNDLLNEMEYLNNDDAELSYAEHCLKYSTDIEELEKVALIEKQNAPLYNMSPDYEYISGIKVKEKSFVEWNDKNNVTWTLAKMFFNKNGRTIDQISSEIFDNRLSESQICDIMLELANNKELFHRTTPLYRDLKEKIKALKIEQKKVLINKKINIKNVSPDNIDGDLLKYAKENNINLEVIGSWLWAFNTSYEQKEQLKRFGFIWSKNRKSWYLRPDESKNYKKSSKVISINEMRGFFGSVEVALGLKNEENLINECPF